MDEHGSVVLRADASEKLGIGHVVRSLTLGKALRELGWTVVLATRELPSDLVERTRAALVDVTFLGKHLNGSGEATEIAGMRPDIVVADRYRLEPGFFETLSQAGTLVCLIDDNGENDHSFADVVLNQNPGARSESYGPPSRNPRLLLGLDYALVRDEILAAQAASSASDRGQTIFVAMGGSDPLRLSEPLVNLLSRESITAAVAIGPATHDRSALAHRLGELAHVTVVPEGDFVRSLATATVAVIGAGTTMWEAAHLGVPTISIVVAANQAQPSSAAAALGFTRCVDGGSTGAVDAIGRQVVQLLGDEATRLDMSQRGRRAVDGAGAARVATLLSDLVARRRRASC
jgi:UDP-2,4-diacetamido-2,4,6-trideoxy-beta-L-altropyranose hydrolase